MARIGRRSKTRLLATESIFLPLSHSLCEHCRDRLATKFSVGMTAGKQDGSGGSGQFNGGCTAVQSSIALSPSSRAGPTLVLAVLVVCSSGIQF